MTDFPYQVMPPLSDDEYVALKADIAARGVQVPVEYDEVGEILDGHHRVKICRELKIAQWPRLIRYGLSEEDKRRHARRLNLDRRHLDHEQKRVLIADDLRETPESSDRAIATGLGVDHKTVGSVRSGLESTGEIPQLETRKGRDKKVRRVTQFVPSNEAEDRGIHLAAQELNARRGTKQREARSALAVALSDKSFDLTGTRQFPCIYADPPWSRKAGIGGRAYENHYPTMTWDEIMALPVKQQTLPDAWLFLWMPRAHVLALHPVKYQIAIDDGSVHEIEIKTPLAWAIARAWGFSEFSTLAVWTKTDEEHPDDHGTGLIFRDQDEILCLFKKGRGLPMPNPANKFGSNHRERSRPLGHSRKPQFYREMIAAMAGGLPVLELFARVDENHPLPPNWEAWGNESQNTASDDAEKRDITNSDGGVEGHAPEGTVAADASGMRERLPRDVEAAGSQGEAEAGLPAEMPRAMEQASDRMSQDSDPIAGPAASRGRDGVEPIPSEDDLYAEANAIIDDIPFVAAFNDDLIVKPLRRGKFR